MGRYKVTTESGSYVVTTEDAEPSQRSVGQNAMADLKDIGQMVAGGVAMPKKMLIDDPMDLARSASQVWQGTPASQTPTGQAFGHTIDSLAGAPRQAWEQAKQLATEPGQAIREHPIRTPLELGSLAFPAARGTIAAGAKYLPAVAERVTPAAIRLADKVVPKVVGTAFSAPEDALRYRMANRGSVDRAVPYSQLADELPRTLGKLGEKLTSQTGAAKKLLRKTPYLMEGAVPKDDVIAVVRGQKRGLGIKGSILGEPQQVASAKLNDLVERVSRIRGETISERDLRKIVEQLDPKIWGQEPAIVQQKIRGIRVRLDQMIKKQNPEFRSAMVPVAKNTRLLKNTRREFGLKEEAGSGLVPTPTTVNRFENILKDRNTVYQRRLDDLKRETGDDFMKRSKDYAVKRQLDGGETNGSRNTLGFGTAGAAAGGFIGGPMGAGLGSAAGGLIGRIVDKRGREIASKLVDSYMRVRPNATVGEFLFEHPTVARAVGGPSSTRRLLRPKPEKILTPEDAKKILKEARGDRNRARLLARERGWTIPE